MTREDIETRAEELVESWINGNQTYVLSELEQGTPSYLRLAMVAAVMRVAGQAGTRAIDSNLVENLCDALVRRVETPRVLDR